MASRRRVAPNTTPDPYLYDMVSNPHKWRLMLSSARKLRDNHNHLYTGKLGSNSLADVTVADATTNLSAYAGSETLKIATWKNATFDQWSFEPSNTIISEMPEIVTSGTINNINGKPAPKFNNSFLDTGTAGYQTILNKTHTAFYLFKTPISKRFAYIAMEGRQSYNGVIGVAPNMIEVPGSLSTIYFRFRPQSRDSKTFYYQGKAQRDTLTLITVRSNRESRQIEYRLNGEPNQMRYSVDAHYIHGPKSFYLGGCKWKFYRYIMNDNTLAEICVINDYLPSNEMEAIESDIMSFWGLI
jgi:hypothetical protein